MLEYDRGFFKEIMRLLHFVLQNFIAEGGEVLYINLIVFDDKLIVAHITQIVPREQFFQGIWI